MSLLSEKFNFNSKYIKKVVNEICLLIMNNENYEFMDNTIKAINNFDTNITKFIFIHENLIHYSDKYYEKMSKIEFEKLSNIIREQNNNMLIIIDFLKFINYPNDIINNDKYNNLLHIINFFEDCKKFLESSEPTDVKINYSIKIVNNYKI